MYIWDNDRSSPLGRSCRRNSPREPRYPFEILEYLGRSSFDQNIHVERIHAANCMPNVFYHMLLYVYICTYILYCTEMHNVARCGHVASVCYTIHRDRRFETRGEKRTKTFLDRKKHTAARHAWSISSFIEQWRNIDGTFQSVSLLVQTRFYELLLV